VADETAPVAPAETGAATAPATGAGTEQSGGATGGGATGGGGRREGGGGYGGGREGGGRGRGGPGGGRGPRKRDGDFFEREQSDLTEKVIFINRSSKVVKGGRRFSFSALVVVGDKKGKVGLGLGKAGEVADAIRKGNEDAKHNLLNVSLKDSTIPHEVFSEYGGARILLRPASPGTGIIAGKTVRAVVESAGVKDILSKSLGSKNAANVAKATLTALQTLRLREQIYKERGMQIRSRARQAGTPVEQVTT
jgi:small subunit ribosomal protein S5